MRLPFRREWALQYTPALLLVAIASFHHYRITVSDQSAWGAGSGFAMFSTLDFHGSRTLRVTIHTSDGAHRVAVDTDAALLARVLPTQANLDALARELLTAPWTTADALNEPRYRLATQNDSRLVEIEQVEVELWRRAFDTSTAQVTVRRTGRAIVP